MAIRDAKKRTLDPREIVTNRSVGRRGALAAIGSVLGMAALASPARAERSGTGASGRAIPTATDSDPNDAPGRGRTGQTDRDSEPNADGVGRGVCPDRGWSDSDPSDPAGRGRGPCH
jgi:hypothetical protein